ncbi:MAG TPA: DUF2130 domain-containing protein, partial [Lachnospiraceae bacterium]|nr:DUF2130 domain-containing protein [Lachnospiraceae bacterium]
MSEIKCPKCGEVFTVDESGYAAIIKQVRDEEFARDLDKRIKELKDHLSREHELELKSALAEAENIKSDKYEKEIEKLSEDMHKLEEEKNSYKTKIMELESELKSSEDKKQIAVMEAVKKAEDKTHDLEKDLMHEKENTKILLAEKDTQIEFYKDLKTKMSTKMVGETLEQHCEIQFNQIRATAFRNAYFEKDNDARTGSKGDYIFRENDEAGNEIVSIMFEMKNENDTTATKHKNEDFFKELDKDRKEKNCE